MSFKITQLNPWCFYDCAHADLDVLVNYMTAYGEEKVIQNEVVCSHEKACKQWKDYRRKLNETIN